MNGYDWSHYSFVCDECGTIGTTDDGFDGPGDYCPAWDDDDPCDGTMRLRGEFYHYSDETGMERWHDGDSTEQRCHDGVGLIMKREVSFETWIATFPDADFTPRED